MGFLTFGSASSGLILNNYSTKDSLMGLSRIAVAVSLVFPHPLAFVGLRDGVLDLLKMKGALHNTKCLDRFSPFDCNLCCLGHSLCELCRGFCWGYLWVCWVQKWQPPLLDIFHNLFCMSVLHHSNWERIHHSSFIIASHTTVL
jgi:hypothetical protein